jgi:hypothetical protein
MKRRRVPSKIVEFTTHMLRNRETRLRFDDHTSEAICIDKE